VQYVYLKKKKKKKKKKKRKKEEASVTYSYVPCMQGPLLHVLGMPKGDNRRERVSTTISVEPEQEATGVPHMH
jgi:hypothetical protein